MDTYQKLPTTYYHRIRRKTPPSPIATLPPPIAPDIRSARAPQGAASANGRPVAARPPRPRVPPPDSASTSVAPRTSVVAVVFCFGCRRRARVLCCLLSVGGGSVVEGRRHVGVYGRRRRRAAPADAGGGGGRRLVVSQREVGREGVS